MADQDGSDASPPESQGEFPPTAKFTLPNFFFFFFFLTRTSCYSSCYVPVGGRCFVWVCPCLNAEWRGDWSPRSRAGHGSGINYQATHPTGCCTFVSHERFPPLNYTDIVSFTVVVVTVVGRYFELLRHLLLTFCHPVAELLQFDVTGEFLTWPEALLARSFVSSGYNFVLWLLQVFKKHI